MFGRLIAAAALIAFMVGVSPSGVAEPGHFAASTTSQLGFTNSGRLDLRSEGVYASPAEIRFDLTVRNNGSAPVTSTITFAYPAVDLSGAAPVVAPFPLRGEVEFLDFKVAVNGRPVPYRLERMAWHGQEEVTDALRLTRALALAPWLTEPLPNQITALPPPSKAELARRGLLATDATGRLRPLWTLALRVVWNQFFAPQEDVRITVAYRPLLTSVETDRLSGVDPSCIHGMERDEPSILDGNAMPRVLAERFGLLLKTGRDWPEPAGRFRLTLDKGEPGTVLIACWPGLRTTNTGSLVFDAKEWRPDRDLDVTLLTFLPP